MTPVITQTPETWPLPGTRCIFRGKLMDYETAAFLLAMEAELGYTLTVVQGCYSNAVGASAGTHGGGGVVDLLPWDFERKVKVARDLGAFAWHRVPAQGPWPEHIHMGIRNHPALSPEAQSQQRDFDAKPRRNGLASHLVDPDQDPGRPTPTFHYPPKVPAVPTFQALQLNDNWANLKSDAPGLIEDFRPLVMGVQEGWRVNYHKTIPSRWDCRQVEATKATAGVAVIWDGRRLERTGASKEAHRLGRGLEVIGKGKDTRDRPVVWRDLRFKAGVERGAMPRVFRPASVHYPPLRDREAWEVFDARLELWIKQSPVPVLLFMDSNQHDGPEGLVKPIAPKYAWHAVERSIDGVVTSLPVRSVKQIPKRTSDHHPVVITLG